MNLVLRRFRCGVLHPDICLCLLRRERIIGLG
jgi:hypothetical protein